MNAMPPEHDDTTGQPPLLLVVDDLEANLEAMRALLGDDENWQLRCANSGEAALRCLLQEDVALVLLDVHMPGMDGYEVAELMRGNPRTRDTPIIFVSAIAQTQEAVLRGYTRGAMDFILKPFNPVFLHHKIHNLLRYENNRRELQRLSQKLQKLSVTDPLTGLLNRRGFYQALEAALARAKRNGSALAVSYLDLDGFKLINDSLGHNTGDELLCYVAEQLKSGLRSYDSLARLGGDEFTVLLEGLDSCLDAAQVADKLIEQISGRHQIGEKEFNLSASVGIACYPECGDDVNSLLRAADMAMYEAKRNGRQQYRFHSPQLTARAHARLELELHLRHAIEQQYFSLAWQPQFYLADGRLRGFEALLRWPRGNPSAARPDQFIPLLEETRLINPLGQWVFGEGIRCMTPLSQRFGNEFLLSLNISPVQFSQPDLADKLAGLLHSHNLPPNQLEVEVTESALMQDLDATRTQLRQLRGLGIKVAVDDFGTGYSSLAYLRYFELDTLKIDRMFIANMLNSPRDAAVVSTIIDLGRHLGLHVIAEGVETQEQRLWLLEHDCAIMQGWLVAPGLPFDAAIQVPAQIGMELGFCNRAEHRINDPYNFLDSPWLLSLLSPKSPDALGCVSPMVP